MEQKVAKPLVVKWKKPDHVLSQALLDFFLFIKISYKVLLLTISIFKHFSMNIESIFYLYEHLKLLEAYYEPKPKAVVTTVVQTPEPP